MTSRSIGRCTVQYTVIGSLSEFSTNYDRTSLIVDIKRIIFEEQNFKRVKERNMGGYPAFNPAVTTVHTLLSLSIDLMNVYDDAPPNWH